MIILLVIILIAYFISATNKKAKIKIDTSKHVSIRIYTLFGVVLLITLGFLIFGGLDGVLAALYGSFYFFCVWLSYLLIEAVTLFITKKDKLARASLLLAIIFAVIVGVAILTFVR